MTWRWRRKADDGTVCGVRIGDMGVAKDGSQKSGYMQGIEIHPGERLVHTANRVETERGFRIDFDLSRVVAEPAAAW